MTMSLSLCMHITVCALYISTVCILYDCYFIALDLIAFFNVVPD